MRILNRKAVEELLDPGELLDAVAAAMADLSAGRASQPHRVGAFAGEHGLLMAMPGYSPSAGALAAKLLTVNPGNAGTPHPTHQAVVAVFDTVTGSLLGLLDGDALTELRTAAGSALSVRLLARPDAQVLAVLGTGPQARAHAMLVAPVREFTEVRIGGRDPARTAAVVAELDARGVAAVACTIPQALEGADVVCTTTSAIEPVVRGGPLAPGAHIASVGYVAAGREVDPVLYAQALVVVEHRETALRPHPVGSNDVLDAVAAGLVAAEDLVELGELVDGRRAGRTSPGQLTLYKSVGVAVQDAAAAALALAAARRVGAGFEVEFGAG